MTDRIRLTIAVLVTALFIGATSLAGLMAHRIAQPTQSLSAPAPAPAKVLHTTNWQQEND